MTRPRFGVCFYKLCAFAVGKAELISYGKQIITLSNCYKLFLREIRVNIW